jgi:low affinity Fe/Cu permease
MLFVIQHTQNRHQVAVQLKLDELIRATPEADDLLVQIENAKDEELIEREQDHLAQHDSLRGTEENVNDLR